MYSININNHGRLPLRCEPENYRTGDVTGTVKNLLLAGTLLLTTAPVLAEGNYFKNALFTPTDNLLGAEARGRITIYDGIDIAMVERALDEQFDRIENMMFVGIRHPAPDGDVIVEDDGC